MTYLRTFCALLVGCASSSPPVLHPQAMRGEVTDPPGKVLVMSATCGSVEHECRDTWAPAVDGVVVSGLEFHGYPTIDPASLRKDERMRTETTVAGETATVSDSTTHVASVDLVFVIPVAGVSTTTSHSVQVVNSHQKTVVLEGARFEDLTLADRQQLTGAADAGSVLATRITAGANYGNWKVAQNVEVMIKLASPTTGKMLWSTRCEASSDQFASIDQAIENAARCAVGGFTGP
ncbi:hypothetical protein BH11MYX1_BH11MYX1_03650 [soil metagenome]